MSGSEPVLVMEICLEADSPCGTEKLTLVGLGTMVAFTGGTPAAMTVMLME